MDDLDFLRIHAPGNGSIMIILPDGAISHIYNLNLTVIAERCPILHLAFEHSLTGTGPKASLEAPSRDVVVYFLRFVYLGDYASYDDFDQKKPCSLLIHAQLCKMADLYSLPDLRAAAHVNFIQETEFSCSQPSPPVDLFPAIRYVYQYLTDYQPLLDTLLNYCVFCFAYHGLGTNPEFRDIAYNLPEFHRDLCLTNYSRDFQDDGAAAIVCLPVYNPTPSIRADVHKRCAADFLFEIWSDAEDSETQRESGAAGKKREKKRRRTLTADGGFALVYRPKTTSEPYIQSSDDSSSDEGFALVHRPRTKPEQGAQCEPGNGDSSGGESGSEAWSDSETDSSQAAQLEDSFMTVKGSSSPPQGVDVKVDHESTMYGSDTSRSTILQMEPIDAASEKREAIIISPSTRPSLTAKLDESFGDRYGSEPLSAFISHIGDPAQRQPCLGETVKELSHTDEVKPQLVSLGDKQAGHRSTDKTSRMDRLPVNATQPTQEAPARKDSIADDDDFFALFNNDTGNSFVPSAHGDSIGGEYEFDDVVYSSESEWSVV
jgi:hypothetical protein